MFSGFMTVWMLTSHKCWHVWDDPSAEEICQVVEDPLPKHLWAMVLFSGDYRLYRRVSQRFKKIRAVSGILSHEEMAKLIGKPFLLISKVGGITTSEALASETPMLIYKPLLG